MKKHNMLAALLAILAVGCEEFGTIFPGQDPGQEEKQTVSLSAISGMATAEGVSFNEKICATVTGVFERQDGKNVFIHLQDSSSAIMLYLEPGKVSLKAGDRVDGAVQGLVSLYSALPRITDIDLADAIITENCPIPVDTLDLKDLLKDYDSYISKRIVLKGVDITTGVSSSSKSGEIAQGGESIVIYNASSSASIAKGKYGDLTAYPSVLGSVKRLNVYTSGMFKEIVIEPADNETGAFQDLTTPGIYNLTNESEPVAIAKASASWQYAFSKQTSARTFRMQNFTDGKLISLKVSASTFISGNTYQASVTSFGDLSYPSGSAKLKVSAATSALVWLVDESLKIGYIIPLS